MWNSAYILILFREMQDNCQTNDLKQTVSSQKRSRGHIDRYNGMTEDEVMQRKLPDYLREGLDLIVVIYWFQTAASIKHLNWYNWYNYLISLNYN